MDKGKKRFYKQCEKLRKKRNKKVRYEEEKFKIQNKRKEVGRRIKEKQFRDDKYGVRERKDKLRDGET